MLFCICRFLALYLSRRDPLALSSKWGKQTKFPSANDILLSKNGLYQLVRRLCVVINQPSLPEKLLDSAIPSIVFLIRAMAYNPELCSNNSEDTQADNEVGEVSKRGERKGSSSNNLSFRAEGLSGCRWPMRRLCALGTDHRGSRRLYVLQVCDV